jgi:acetoin utilization deacetylase AcuC-like enzyme
MLLYESQRRRALSEYGIGIPIKDDKIRRILEHLGSDPAASALLPSLIIDHIGESIGRDDLLRVHDPGYVDRLLSDHPEPEIMAAYELLDQEGRYRRYDPAKADLPLSTLRDQELLKAGGTLQCCRLALERGFCFYFGGGSHHAQRGYGIGFCPVNDIVIALRRLQSEGRIATAWVIDVDAHKGDGTAALTVGDSSIVTLSIHMASGWPLDGEAVVDGKPNPSFIDSDIDVPVEEGDDARYNILLASGLKRLSAYPRPDLCVVVSGADPYEKDELPSTAPLKLSLAQMEERDALVYGFLHDRKISKAYLMAGGYGSSSWEVYARFLAKVLPTL